MGYASALAWVMFLIVLALTLVVFRSAPMWVHYQETQGGQGMTAADPSRQATTVQCRSRDVRLRREDPRQVDRSLTILTLGAHRDHGPVLLDDLDLAQGPGQPLPLPAPVDSRIRCVWSNFREVWDAVPFATFTKNTAVIVAW